MDRDAVESTPDGARDDTPKSPRLSMDESSDSDDDSKHEPLKRAAFPINKHKRRGYQHAPTTSYSDLQNASMYSLNEHESIIDINGEGAAGETSGNPEGWPVFEPLDGPYPLEVYKKDFKQLKNEILSGLVVSFAQVPEAVAFSFLAGVDPFIGLHAAWIVGFITSFFGGRCAEISGATGSHSNVQIFKSIPCRFDSDFLIWDHLTVNILLSCCELIHSDSRIPFKFHLKFH